jgi:hypothetical protein
MLHKMLRIKSTRGCGRGTSTMKCQISSIGRQSLPSKRREKRNRKPKKKRMNYFRSKSKI